MCVWPPWMRGKRLPAGEALSNWVAANMAKTGKSDDRMSTAALWKLMVKAGGDPPWGYTRRKVYAAVRDTLDLAPARKIRIDGKAVNGWEGLTVVKAGDGEASRERY